MASRWQRRPSTTGGGKRSTKRDFRAAGRAVGWKAAAAAKEDQNFVHFERNPDTLFASKPMMFETTAWRTQEKLKKLKQTTPSIQSLSEWARTSGPSPTTASSHRP